MNTPVSLFLFTTLVLGTTLYITGDFPSAPGRTLSTCTINSLLTLSSAATSVTLTSLESVAPALNPVTVRMNSVLSATFSTPVQLTVVLSALLSEA